MRATPRQKLVRASPKARILEQQIAWAHRRDFVADASGYVVHLEQNLFQPMNPSTRVAFERGAGSELHASDGRRPKLCALHSSAALAVNVFDYWVGRTLAPLQDALGARVELLGVEFERRFPTGLAGTPPTLDVVLETSNSGVLAIESKFTEWMTRAGSGGSGLSASYFADGRRLWANRGLPRCQALAERISEGKERFDWLNVPQLLKHGLGLAATQNRPCSLVYVFYDFACEESVSHRHETERFMEAVGDDLNFTSLSYQDLFERLLDICWEAHEDYLKYLAARYFGSAHSTGVALGPEKSR